MNQELKNYFFLIWTGFRKITKKKRILNILQFIVDILIGYECVFPLLSVYNLLPFTVLLVVLAKIIFHTLKRDSLGNFIGICLNTLFIIMTLIFKLGFSFMPIVAYIIHFMRLKSCYIDSKLKKIYGYPSFHTLFLENELSEKPLLAESVQADYNKTLENSIIKFSVAESRCNIKIQIMKLVGSLLLCMGIVLFYFGKKENLAYDNAVFVTSLDTCSIGANISGTVYELYDNSYIGLSYNVNDGYWGVFGDKLILFDVPYRYKNSFASLYNFYANQYELISSIGTGGGEIANPENGIEFHGQLLSANEYDFTIYKPDIKNLKIEIPEAETSCFIRVINYEKADLLENMGIIFIIIGMAMIAIFMVSICKKLY